jgi:hypothetical protein
LSTALNHEAALNALGTTLAYGQLVAALASRLRAAALWRRHPEIAEVHFPSPIIVVGHMRSGSTRMQRLLACDEQFAFTRFYESWNPLPRWNWLPLDDRKLRAWLALRVAQALNPQFAVIHPTSASEADEEIGLHNIALYGAAFETQWHIPGFTQYGETIDSREIYAEFRRYLQTISWLRRDSDKRSWILKVPQFSQDLGTVLEAFPGARLVVLHRDPVEVVGSSASLVHNQMRVQSDRIDPAWIGKEVLRKVALRQRRIVAARRQHDVPSIDVTFAAMQTDWRSEIAKVYDLLNCRLTPSAERRMQLFLSTPRHATLPAHRYAIGDYGLTVMQIRQAMADGGTERPCVDRPTQT